MSKVIAAFFMSVQATTFDADETYVRGPLTISTNPKHVSGSVPLTRKEKDTISLYSAVLFAERGHVPKAEYALTRMLIVNLDEIEGTLEYDENGPSAFRILSVKLRD